MSAQVHCRGPLLLLYCKLLSSRDKVGEMNIHHMVKPNQFLKRSRPYQSEWLGSKSLQVINAGEGMEKREASYTVGGNAN